MAEITEATMVLNGVREHLQQVGLRAGDLATSLDLDIEVLLPVTPERIAEVVQAQHDRRRALDMLRDIEVYARQYDAEQVLWLLLQELIVSVNWEPQTHATHAQLDLLVMAKITNELYIRRDPRNSR